MNTNIHEWKKATENKWGIEVEKEIREHSCSFVADFHPLNKFFSTNHRFAGLSANRRMKYGYQYSPYGT